MKEEDIRSRSVFDQWLKLVEEDVKAFFDFERFVDVPCPACGGQRLNHEFEKFDFGYVSCGDCRTLFVGRRPPFEMLKSFYTDSASTAYFVEQFFAPVAEARREKIFRPRAEYVANVLGLGDGAVIGDIGAGFGLFLEETRRMAPKGRYIAIEPSAEMAEICRNKGLETIEACLEEVNLPGSPFDLLTVFELIEHLFDPLPFLTQAFSLLKPGGRLLLTGLNGKGFDVTVLWEKSRSICPPLHLTLFNTDSIRALLMRAGFEVVSVSTPGELDWDIVEGIIEQQGPIGNRFWDFVAREGNEQCKRELQEWVKRNGFSSHMRVVARRPLGSGSIVKEI